MKILHRTTDSIPEMARPTFRRMGSLSEINARKQLNDCFGAAIELSPDAFILTDPKGYILRVNPAFERMTGYSRDEAKGRTLHILDSGKHDATFFRTMRDSLAREGVWKGRLLSKKKDGALFYEDCTISPVKNTWGDVMHYITIKRDVMDVMRLEAIAEEVVSEKNIGRIFSGVRHEIGNIFNTLFMVLGMLKSKLVQYDTRTIEAHVERALDQVQKGAHLLRRLKTCNMYEQPELQNIGLREFMDKLICLVGQDFASKGIAISMLIDPDAEQCHADPRLLQQAIVNLLANSVDALLGREQPMISLSVFRTGDEVMMRVEDNGCGMSEEQQRNLFKPFYTTKTHGTGLGLVIVRKLLTGIDCSVEVASHRGVGTVVDILIPVHGRRAATTGEVSPVQSHNRAPAFCSRTYDKAS